eukprot:15194344-Alexandrium_andersonii.AAC.2
MPLKCLSGPGGSSKAAPESSGKLWRARESSGELRRALESPGELWRAKRSLNQGIKNVKPADPVWTALAGTGKASREGAAGAPGDRPGGRHAVELLSGAGGCWQCWPTLELTDSDARLLLPKTVGN